MPQAGSTRSRGRGPSRGAALPLQAIPQQTCSAVRSSCSSQTRVVQEDQGLPKGREPGQEQDKAKLRQGDRQPTSLPSPPLFHMSGDAGNPAGELGHILCQALPPLAILGCVELPYPGAGERRFPQIALCFLAPGSQVLFGGLGIKTVFSGSAGLGDILGEAC